MRGGGSAGGSLRTDDTAEHTADSAPGGVDAAQRSVGIKTGGFVRDARRRVAEGGADEGLDTGIRIGGFAGLDHPHGPGRGVRTRRARRGGGRGRGAAAGRAVEAVSACGGGRGGGRPGAGGCRFRLPPGGADESEPVGALLAPRGVDLHKVGGVGLPHDGVDALEPGGPAAPEIGAEHDAEKLGVDDFDDEMPEILDRIKKREPPAQRGQTRRVGQRADEKRVGKDILGAGGGHAERRGSGISGKPCQYRSLQQRARTGTADRGRRAGAALPFRPRGPAAPGRGRTMAEGLNKAQQTAVDYDDDKPSLILAGPGSGKTRVLCKRMEKLIDRGAEPDRVLAITFMAGAAEEMRERLGDSLDHPPENVMTFHALARKMLKERGRQIGLQDGWEIADAGKAAGYVEKATKNLGLNTEAFEPSETAKLISWRKNHEIDPAGQTDKNGRQIGTTERISRDIEIEYRKLMEEDQMLDFDDLLEKTVELLEDPAERAYQSGRWEHVLVDEWQDTNLPQYKIMKGIAEHGRVTAVGDPDQGMYAWRGAERANIERFKEDFKPEVINLNLNYRSTPNIVKASRAVIESDHAGGRDEIVDKRELESILPDSEEGDKIGIVIHPTDKSESAWIHNMAVKTYEKPGTNRENQLGVLYRINALSRPIEEKLIQSEIPYTISGGNRFYEREEVLDAVAYLKLTEDPSDDESFYRVVDKPARGLGPKALEKIEEIGADDAPAMDEDSAALFGGGAVSDDKPMWEKLQEAVRTPGLLDKNQQAGAEKLLATIKAGRDIIDSSDREDPTVVPNVLKEVMRDYKSKLARRGRNEDENKLENIYQLETAATEYGRQKDGREHARGSVDGFIQRADKLAAGGPEGDDTKIRVHLKTFHSAKGLEFSTVIMAGTEAGLCPLKPRKADARNLDDRLMEECRAFYVGMTRAEDRLLLSRAGVRMRGGNPQKTVESPYIAEIPRECRKTYRIAETKIKPPKEPIVLKEDPEVEREETPRDAPKTEERGGPPREMTAEELFGGTAPPEAGARKVRERPPPPPPPPEPVWEYAPPDPNASDAEQLFSMDGGDGVYDDPETPVRGNDTGPGAAETAARVRSDNGAGTPGGENAGAR